MGSLLTDSKEKSLDLGVSDGAGGYLAVPGPGHGKADGASIDPAEAAWKCHERRGPQRTAQGWQRERPSEKWRATTAVLANSLYHQHVKGRGALGLPTAFVVHSFRRTFCTRMGEAGAEAFLIQRMAGHDSVTVSERYVHPTPEAMDLAAARLDAANRRACPVYQPAPNPAPALCKLLNVNR